MDKQNNVSTTITWSESHPNLKPALRMCLFAGAFNIFWFIMCQPKEILSIFIQEHLQGGPEVLGYAVGAINLAGALNLVSIILVGRLRERRLVWFWYTFMARLGAFAIAGASFWLAAGGNRPIALIIVVVASIWAAIGNSLGGSAWWSWMGDLIPDSIRASFFGKRSAIVQAINLSFFFLANVLIDGKSAHLFYVYGALYLFAGIAGLLEVFFQLRAPDPAKDSIAPFNFKDFFVPLRDSRFRHFCLAMGAYILSINLAGPFLAAFIVSPKAIGAPQYWMGISMAISQGIWVLIVPLWGRLMDKIGRRAVVVIGGFFVISWVPYLFMTPDNYGVLLVISSLIAGLISPAYWEGISQYMITLSPTGHRTAYAGWFWTWFGLTAAIGPVIGGVCYSWLSGLQIQLLGLSLSPLQVLIVASIIFASLSQIAMSKAPAPKESDKSVLQLLVTLFVPGIFRAAVSGYFNVPELSPEPKKTEPPEASKNN